MKPFLHFLILRFFNQVYHFLGVFFQIIQFITGHEIQHHFVSAVINTPQRLITAEAVMVNLISSKFHKHIIVAASLRIQNFLPDTSALKHFRNGHTEDVKNSGRQIDMRNRIGIYTLSQPPDNQRNMYNLLIQRRAFSCKGMGIHHISVIRGVNDNGRVLLLFCRVYHSSDFIVCKSIAAQKFLWLQRKVFPAGLQILLPGPDSVMFRLILQSVLHIFLYGNLIVFI